MENIGNNDIKAGGGKVDTGKKWFDANGDPHIVYRKTLALDGTTSSLPNTTTKNVLHGESLNVQKYARVKELRADNGTTVKGLNSSGITVDINATQIAITTASDLSLYIRGLVTIEFCL